MVLLSIMKHSRSSVKRAVNNACPLEDAGILLHILKILGPGQHLFISAVSKAWAESYQNVASVQIAGLTYGDPQAAVGQTSTITSKTTLCSAVFIYADRARLAHECDLCFECAMVQRIAGSEASISTLQAALELGLTFTAELLYGAAKADVPKMQWLHTEQGCQLPYHICDEAAGSGSMDMLRWSRQRGCVLSSKCCEGAAAGAHLHILQFLRDEGCEWDETACTAAARNGHLTTLQWLHEHGCPWDNDSIRGYAAESGCLEMLRFLQQEGCVYGEDTMAGAAWGGAPGYLPVLGSRAVSFWRRCVCASRCKWSSGHSSLPA
jgi:hypothetical protein